MERRLATEATEETDVDLCLNVLGPEADFTGSTGLATGFGSAFAVAALFWAFMAAALLLTVDPIAGRAAGIALAGMVDVFSVVDACEGAEGSPLRVLPIVV
jgi:hypothetical protein